MTKIHQVLNLDIDLEADVQSGYPGVICRLGKIIRKSNPFHF